MCILNHVDLNRVQRDMRRSHCACGSGDILDSIEIGDVEELARRYPDAADMIRSIARSVA
jgi:hypothetical protein